MAVRTKAPRVEMVVGSRKRYTDIARIDVQTIENANNIRGSTYYRSRHADEAHPSAHHIKRWRQYRLKEGC